MSRYTYPVLFALIILTYAATASYMYGKDMQREKYGEMYDFVSENADYITLIERNVIESRFNQGEL